jgi:hypothetical protein
MSQKQQPVRASLTTIPPVQLKHDELPGRGAIAPSGHEAQAVLAWPEEKKPGAHGVQASDPEDAEKVPGVQARQLVRAWSNV